MKVFESFELTDLRLYAMHRNVESLYVVQVGVVAAAGEIAFLQIQTPTGVLSVPTGLNPFENPTDIDISACTAFNLGAAARLIVCMVKQCR